jgi:hypothetical protein
MSIGFILYNGPIARQTEIALWAAEVRKNKTTDLNKLKTIRL